jgi:hypothetical protein
MKFQNAFIAALICFLLSLNVAEAAPVKNNKGHNRSHNWHQVWHRFWHAKRHIKFRAPKLFASPSKAPQTYNAPTQTVTAQAPRQDNDKKDFNGTKSSGLGGIFSPPAIHDKPDYVKAPEISVASGASTLALLAGLLLLVSERSRIRKV